MWDAVGTISIGVLLIVIAFFVAIEVKDLLIGQSVDPSTLAEMKTFLNARPEIEQVFSLLTMQFGPDAMVAIKARMVPTGTEHGHDYHNQHGRARIPFQFPIHYLAVF